MDYIFLLCVLKTQQECHTLKLLIITVLPFSAPSYGSQIICFSIIPFNKLYSLFM